MAHDVYHLGLSKISVVLDGWWATFDSFIDRRLQQIIFNASTDPQLLSSGIIYDLLHLEGTLVISNNLLHLETWYWYPNQLSGEEVVTVYVQWPFVDDSFLPDVLPL